MGKQVKVKPDFLEISEEANNQQIHLDPSLFTQRSSFIGNKNNLDFGESKYDTNVPVSMVESGDYKYLRGQKQSHWDKSIHGIGRAVGAAAQTLYDGTAGIGYGIIRYSSDLALDELNKKKYISEHGNLEGYKSPSWTTIFDNTATRAGEEYIKDLEEIAPLYNTKDYENASGLEKLGYFNFWADDVLKGIGTTVGSMPLGAVGSKLFNAIGKNFVAGKLANGIKTSLTGAENLETILIDQAKKIKLYNAGDILTASMFAAVSESGMEARGTKDKYIQQMTEKLTNGGQRELTQGEKDWLEMTAEDVQKSSFLTNMGVITSADFFTFGKYMISNKSAKYLDDLEKISSRTNVNAGKAVSRTVKEGGKLGTDYTATEFSKAYKVYNTTKKAIKNVLGTNLGEGIEEGLQTATDWGVIDYGKQKYFGKQDAESFLHSLGAAYEGAISGEGVESFLAGFISGGVSNTILSKGSNIKEMFTKDPVVNNALKELNLYNSKSVFGELIKGVAEQQVAAAKMDNAGENTFEFNNAQSDLATSYVLSRVKTGKFDDLISDLEEFKSMPQEEIEKMFGVKIGDEGKRSIIEYITEKADLAKEIKKIHDASYVVFPEKTISDNNRDRLIHANVSILNTQKRMNSLTKEINQKSLDAVKTSFANGISTVDIENFYRADGSTVNYNLLSGEERTKVKKEIIERLNSSNIAPIEIPGIIKKINDLDKLGVRYMAYRDIYNDLLDPAKAESLDKEDAKIEAEIALETANKQALETKKQKIVDNFKETEKAKIEDEKLKLIAEAQESAIANGGTPDDVDYEQIEEETRKKNAFIDSLDIDGAIKESLKSHGVNVEDIDLTQNLEEHLENYDYEGNYKEEQENFVRLKGYITPKGSRQSVKYYGEQVTSDGTINYLDAEGAVIGNSDTHIKSTQTKTGDPSGREVLSGVKHFNKMTLSYDKRSIEGDEKKKRDILEILYLISKNPSKIKDYVRIKLKNETALKNKANNTIYKTEGNEYFNILPEHNIDTEIVLTHPETKKEIQSNWLKSPNVYTPKKEMVLDGITYKPGDRIDLSKITYKTFIKYFTFDISKEMTELEFETFQRSVAEINAFRQQLNNFFEASGKPKEGVPAAEELYNLALHWEYNYIQDDNIPYPTLDKVQYAKNKNGKYVIYQTGIETFLKGPDLENGDIDTVPSAHGTWLQLHLPDGTKKWLQLRPGKTKEATKVKERIQEAADKLAKVQPGSNSRTEAQSIIKELGLFIAGKPGMRLDFGYGWNKKLNKFTLRFNVNDKSIDMSEPVAKDSDVIMLDESLDRFINRINYYLGSKIVTTESFREDISGRDNIKDIADKYVSTADANNPMIPTTINIIPTGKTVSPKPTNKTKTTTTTSTDIESKKADIERRRQEELSGKRTPEELSKIQQTYENNIKELEEFKKYGNTIEEVFDNLHDEVINTNPVPKLRSQGLSDEQIDKHPEFIEWKRKSDLIDRINDYYSPRTIMNDGRTKTIDDFITEEKDSIKELPNKKKRLGKSNIDSINAKYDAELAALEKGEKTTEEKKKIKPSEKKGLFDDDGNLIENAKENKEISSKAQEALNKAKSLENKGVNRKKGKKLSTISSKEKINLIEAFEYLRSILPQSINLSVIQEQFQNGKMLWGYFSDSVLALSARAGKGTEYHEAFHAVFRTLLGDRNIDAYINEAKKETNYSKEVLAAKIKAIKEDYAEENLTDKEAEDLVYEEYLADKFMAWKLDIKTNTSAKNKSLFRRIWDFIKSFLSHKTHIDKLFERIDTGYYKYSDPVVNRFTETGKIAKKSIPGLSIGDTREIVNTIAAMVKESGKKPEIVIEEYIDNIVNPDSDFNKEYKSSELIEHLKYTYEILTSEEGFSRLNLEVAKKLSNYNYNPITESFEALEESEGSLENWQFDHFNVGGVSLLNDDVRAIIGLTLYDTVDQFGRKIRKAVDLDTVYNTIITNTIDTPSNNFIPKLEKLSKYNPQLRAVVSKIKNLTEDKGLVGEQLFKKIIKSFERTKMNYLTIRSNTDGRINIFNSNNKSPEKKLFDNWSNRWIGGIQKKFQNNESVGKDFRKQVSLINKAINNNSAKIGNKKFQTVVMETLNSIGIDITEGTIDLFFTPETADNKIELQALREEFSSIERPVDNFWTALTKLVESGDPLFKGKLETNKEENVGFVKQLAILAEAEKHFRDDLFESSFQDARNKQRYSFIMQSYLTDTLSQLKKDYTNKKEIDRALEDPYLKNNPLLKIFKNDIFGVFKNMDLFFTGDLVETTEEFKRSEKVDGVTAKNIRPKEYLLNMLALFSDGVKEGPDSSGITRAKYIIGVEEGKSQIYAVSLPVLSTLVDGKGELTEDGVNQIYNSIFTQEIERLLNPNDNSPHKGKFAYFSGLNNETKYKNFHEALKNIVSDRRVFETEAKLAISSLFKEEIENLKKTVLDYKLESRLKEGVEAFKNLDTFLGTALVNDFLMSTAMDQLIDGDLSRYANIVDKWKRNSGRVAAGINRSGRTINVAYSTAVKEKGDSEVSGDDLIPSDDGQVLSTLQDRINMLEDFGRLTPRIQRILNDLNSEDPEKVYGVTIDELQEVDLVPSKLVTYGIDDQGNHIYHKMSVLPLSKRLTSYYDYTDKQWKALPGKEGLHNKRVWMETNGVDQLISLSASKMQNPSDVLDHNIFNKANFDSNFGATKKDNKYKTSYDGKHQRLQVENDSGSTTIVNGTQKIQLITSGLDMSKSQNVKDVNEYYDKLNQLRQNLFNDAMHLLSKNNKRKEDIALFIDKLLRNAESSGGNFILEQFLAEEGGDFKYDPNLPHLLSQFEKYFLAHFNKGTLIQKTAGNKLTLASNVGYKIAVGTDGKIITPEQIRENPKIEIATTRDLKIHKFTNDTLQYAEVAMTRRSAQLLGLKIGDELTIEELKTMLGSRIPTQLQHSLMPFKIVEFLPDEYGDTIICPKELVWLSGADFDIDKLYVYRKNYYINNEGKVTIFGKGNKFEEYKKSHNRSPIVKDVLKKLLSQDSRYINLKSRLERIEEFLNDPKVKLQSSKLPSLNNSIYQLKALLNAINDVSADTTSLKEELLKANMLKDSIIDSLNKYAKNNSMLQLTLGGKSYKELLDELDVVTEDVTRQTYKELNLAYTLTEYNSLGSPKANETLQNELLDLELSLLNRPELHGRMKTPASVDTLRNLAEKLTHKKELSQLSLSLLSKFLGKRSIDIGKENIGIAANGNILNAWLTTNQISVKPEYGISIDNKYYTSFSPINEEDFDLDSKNIITKDKSDTISTELSAATDNAKIQLADLVNRTPAILNDVLVMQSLGVGQTRSTLMAVQPVMKELVTELELSNSNIDKKQIKKGDIGLYKFSDILSNKADLLSSEIEQEIGKLSDGPEKQSLIESLENPKVTSEDLLTIHIKSILEEPLTIQDKLVQLGVIKNFLAAETIYGANSRLLSLLKVNKGVGSELDNLDKIQEDFKELTKKESIPYEKDFIGKFRNHPNIKGNIEITNKIKKLSSNFFIRQTEGYSNFANRLLRLFPNKESRSAKKAVNGILDFLNLKIYEKALKVAYEDNNFTLGSLNTLAYPDYEEGSKTLAAQFSELMEKYSEFANNDLIKWLRISPASENYNKADKLGMDTRSKLSNDILEKFSESLKDLYLSENEEIRNFSLSLFDYLVVTGNLKFTNDSLIKFISPEFFKDISDNLKELTKLLTTVKTKNAKGNIISVEDISEKIVSLTGYTFNELSNMYIELYARGVKSSKNIINIQSDKMLGYFNVTEEEGVVEMSPKDIKTVKGNGIITVEGNDEDITIKYPKFVRSSTYSLMGAESSSIYKLESVKDGKAIYKNVSKLSDLNNPILHMTPTEAERYTDYIQSKIYDSNRLSANREIGEEELYEVQNNYRYSKDTNEYNVDITDVEDLLSDEYVPTTHEDDPGATLPLDKADLIGNLITREDTEYDIDSAEEEYDFDSVVEDYDTDSAHVDEGKEISSNAKGLAAALTNPTELAKSKGNLTQSYPVTYKGKTYKDAEAAYQALKATATKDEGPNNTYNLMVDIIKAKLEQYPQLVEEITKQGGSQWILASTHQPTKKNTVWETGGKNWFIKALNDAYLSQIPTKQQNNKPEDLEDCGG